MISEVTDLIYIKRSYCLFLLFFWWKRLTQLLGVSSYSSQLRRLAAHFDLGYGEFENLSCFPNSGGLTKDIMDFPYGEWRIRGSGARHWVHTYQAVLLLTVLILCSKICFFQNCSNLVRKDDKSREKRASNGFLVVIPINFAFRVLD